MNLPSAQFGVQLLIFSVPVANASEAQLTHGMPVRTSFSSAHVSTKLEGRICGLLRQLTTTAVPPAGGADRAAAVQAVSRLWAGAVAGTRGEPPPARTPARASATRLSAIGESAAASRLGECVMGSVPSAVPARGFTTT